jgi:hypothetical protein
MSGDRIMHHSVSIVRCSSNVKRDNRSGPACAVMPMRPSGSMSASPQAPGTWCGAQRAARWNISFSDSQSSHRSSEIRHISAVSRSSSRCEKDSSFPGERLSTIGRPHLSIAREYAAISVRCTGGCRTSSSFTKSTPHSANRASCES